MVADGRITGVVTSGAADSVLIEGADQCGHAIARSVTPVDGYFSFVGLLPGTYRLTVDGRAPVQIALGPGAMECERGDVLSTGTRIREESIGAHRLIVCLRLS